MYITHCCWLEVATCLDGLTRYLGWNHVVKQEKCNRILPHQRFISFNSTTLFYHINGKNLYNVFEAQHRSMFASWAKRLGFGVQNYPT